MKSNAILIGLGLGVVAILLLRRKKPTLQGEMFEEGSEESLGGGGGGFGSGGSTTADIVQSPVVPSTAVVYPVKPYTEYKEQDPIKEAIASGDLVLTPSGTSTTSTSTSTSTSPTTTTPTANVSSSNRTEKVSRFLNANGFDGENAYLNVNLDFEGNVD